MMNAFIPTIYLLLGKSDTRLKMKRNPRKSPVQSRSKEMVQAILEASARVLSQSGFNRSTTNRIAEVAGVSIGSLYQYFPGKDALVGALLDHQIDKNFKKIEEKLKSTEALSLEQSITLLTKSVVEIFIPEANFFRKLFSIAPYLGRLDSIIQSRQKGAELFKSILEKHKDRLEGKDLEILSLISVNAVMGVIQFIGMAGLPSSLSKDQLSSELENLLIGYLIEK
jgi:AcrR family transcriptional regulator